VAAVTAVLAGAWIVPSLLSEGTRGFNLADYPAQLIVKGNGEISWP
jgi:hypothetical protein